MALSYNCICDTAVLSVKRVGYEAFVAGSGERLVTGLLNKRPAGVPIKYVKEVAGTLSEMTGAEKVAVDVTLTVVSQLNSTGAILCASTYGIPDDLPLVPREDNLIVTIANATLGGFPPAPGLALSAGDVWYIFEATYLHSPDL